MRRLLTLALVFCFLVGLVPVDKVTADNAGAPEPSVLISKIYIKEQHNAFIELYNYGESEVSILDWQVQYKQAESGSWADRISAGQELVDHTIQPQSSFTLGSNAFMEDYEMETDLRINWPTAPNDGHVRLLAPGQASEIVVDLVGWGSADSALGSPAPSMGQGESLQRCFGRDDGLLVNTDNNAADFAVYEGLTPGEEIECAEQQQEEEQEQEEGDGGNNGASPEEPYLPETFCEGVVVSEISPRPGSGEQFIELYNFTDEVVSLEGCGLQRQNRTHIHWFDEHSLDPHEHKAFYESDTGVSLVKTVSGTVYLLSSQEQEIEQQSITYPSMDEDSSWAWFGNDDWQQTYTLTPDQPNVMQPTKPCPEGQYRHPDTNRCRNIETNESELKPCDENQYRNPETNRCRLIEAAASTLTPCRPDQERNPATNRCRAIGGSSSSLVPCRPGQERNPATNRCRSTSSAASSLKPCAPGQERNPETNRCRKVVSDNDSAIADIQDVEAVQTPLPGSWWIAGISAIFAIGYAVWEWRGDIARLFSRAKGKSLSPSK